MIRSFTILSLVLCLTFALLIFAARVWGSAMPPSALLAYTSGDITNTTLRVIDLSSRIEINLGRITLDFFSQPTWSADGRLAFVSHREGNSEIYVWDQRTLTNISRNAAADFSPIWSVDGRLAFISRRNVYEQVYVWDGTSLTNVSQPSIDERRISWSADGRLAITSYENEVRVWDGTTSISVFQDVSSFDFQMEWSTDGRLAFISYQNNYSEIFIWDETALITVPQTAPHHSDLAWSADGRLAFVSDGDDTSGEVYVWDGTAVINVSQHPNARDIYPVWSSDGRLAFMSSLGGSDDLYIWDGTTLSNITQTPQAYDLSPAWSTDGQLAFTTSSPNADCNIHIWDGISTIQLTHGWACELSPIWWTP